MSRTVVEYGDMTMYNPVTRLVQQIPVRDSSGADQLYSRFRLRFTGLIHLSSYDIHGFDASGDTLAARFPTVTKKMTAERKVFRWIVDNEELLTALPTTRGRGSLRNRDVNNGPKPQGFTVTKVIGQISLEVEWEIEFCLVHCTEYNNTSGVLSNRWAMSDVIDRDHYTTRTYSGELVITSPLVDDLGPHGFRHLVIPPLPKGFQREQIDVTASPDGLKLLYTVRDKQISYGPPSPATSWEGTHEVHGTQAAGSMGTTISCRVRLNGPEGVSKVQLLGAAIKVCTERMTYESGGVAVMLLDQRFVDHLDKNSAEVSMVGWTAASTIHDTSIVDSGKIGKPLTISGYNRFESRAPKNFGTASTVGLLVAYLQDPCEDEHRIAPKSGDSGQPTKGGVSSDSGVVPETYEGVGNFDTKTQSFYEDAHQKKPYSHYRMESIYVVDSHKCQCPIARSSDSSNKKTAFIATLSQPTSKRIVRVHAERIAAPPQLPIAADFKDENGIQYSIHKATIGYQAPEVSIDGVSKLFSATVDYEFFMDRNITAKEKFRSGSMPWDKTTLGDNLISADTFETGIA